MLPWTHGNALARATLRCTSTNGTIHHPPPPTLTEQMDEPLAEVKGEQVPLSTTGSSLNPVPPPPTAAVSSAVEPLQNGCVGGYRHTSVLEGLHTHIRRRQILTGIPFQVLSQDRHYKPAKKLPSMTAGSDVADGTVDGTAVMAADETAVETAAAADERSDDDSDGSMPGLVANDGNDG